MQLEGFQDISQILRSGVYALCHAGAVVYVGKSKNLYARIYSHRYAYTKARQGKSIPNYMPVKGILFDAVFVFPARVDQLDELERAMIAKYQPRFNVKLKDLTPPPKLNLRINGRVIPLAPPSTFERRV